MPEFDFHAAIKELAEVELACSGCGLNCDCVPGTDYHCKSHVTCNGTGRIVPFVSLRVPCIGKHIGFSHSEVDDYEYDASCEQVGCRRWVPEMDEEKACWGVEDVLIKAGWSVTYAEGYGYAVTNAEGHARVMFEPVRTKAVLRTALAWADKRGG